MSSLYQYVRLGMHVEYLRGVASVSIIPATSLVAFPHVMENQPNTRYNVMKVVEAVRSILLQLDELGLAQTRAAAAPLEPLLREMEEALAGAPHPATVILRDHFAEKLVEIAKQVAVALKAESAAQVA